MIPIVEYMNADIQKIKQGNQKDLIVYPADYEIIVKGTLDISWSQRMSDMSITITGGSGLTAKTTLRGNLVDQSALLGVLNTLHDLRYDILLVKHISPIGSNNAGNK